MRLVMIPIEPYGFTSVPKGSAEMLPSIRKAVLLEWIRSPVRGVGDRAETYPRLLSLDSAGWSDSSGTLILK